jgi:hypothetical protein
VGPGEAFLVQRWEAPVDAAPDGVAIIAVDESSGELIQHYFDSRGVVRRYGMSIEDGIWSLRKLTAGFAQRFRGASTCSGAAGTRSASSPSTATARRRCSACGSGVASQLP